MISQKNTTENELSGYGKGSSSMLKRSQRNFSDRSEPSRSRPAHLLHEGAALRPEEVRERQVQVGELVEQIGHEVRVRAELQRRSLDVTHATPRVQEAPEGFVDVAGKCLAARRRW